MPDLNYKNLIENLYRGLLYVDKEMRITYWNKNAEVITGYSHTEVLNKVYSKEFLCPTDTDGKRYYDDLNLFSDTLLTGTFKQFKLLFTHKDGHKIPISLIVAPIYDINDNIVGATQLFTNNIEDLERKVKNSEEYRNSYFDKVTKLPNKLNLEMEIDSKLSEFRRYNRPFGMLFFEIDNFDKLSKIYGDEFEVNVLTILSNILTKDLHPFDIAGRWSDKEFAIILANAMEQNVKMIGEELKDIVENVDFKIGKGSLDITLSISGIIITSDDSTKTLIEKLQNTIEKCILTGGNTFQIWSPIK